MEGLYDIHAHIVPHFDDGSKSLDETRQILELEYRDGVRTIIATSHFRRGMFETPLHVYDEQFERVRKLGESMGITILKGCEFHANMEMIDMLNKKERYTMADGRCVLAEFKNGSDKAFIKERCYALLSHGYQPIVAHFERYEACRKDIDFVAELVDMGCYMQMNSQSLIGEDGFFLKQYCKKVIKYELVHFLATDCHNTKERKPTLGKAAEYIEKFMGEDYVRELLIENPRKLIIEEK